VGHVYSNQELLFVLVARKKQAKKYAIHAPAQDASMNVP